MIPIVPSKKTWISPNNKTTVPSGQRDGGYLLPWWEVFEKKKLEYRLIFLSWIAVQNLLS